MSLIGGAGLASLPRSLWLRGDGERCFKRCRDRQQIGIATAGTDDLKAEWHAVAVQADRQADCRMPGQRYHIEQRQPVEIGAGCLPSISVG